MSWPRALVIGSVVVACALAVWFLPLAEWTTRLAEYARETGPTGVAVFFAAYVASTVAMLPGSILTLAAGFAYGPVWGLALASPASVTGATCAFLFGRTVLRGWAQRQVDRSPRVRAIDAAVEREGFKLVLLLRLSPLFPFNVLNYALSLTRVTLGRYVLASAIGMLPGTALYVYLGSLAPAAAELSAATRGGSSTRTALYVVGLLATAVVVFIATRAARRALHAELEGERS
ncbi:MAG: TVP38/TMEM64 family protein [Planctomycetota bacterium]|nr:TVP38/TMEM64 family protein [Planctomycetota bacterium]